MGFTDLLTSSRGPGVIGTLLALLVLVGFGTLYMFVFDEQMQGGAKTIEAVIRDQGIEIDTHKVQIENSKKRMEEAVGLKARVKEADDLKARAEFAVKSIAELKSRKEQAAADIGTATAAWEKYKDQYRASEWAAAVGEKLTDIKTAKGDVYSKVVISQVDHTGVRVSHSSGSKTIPPEDLPPDLHDRFQFSEEKTTEVRVKIDDDFKDLSDNVEIATLAKSANEKLIRIEQLKGEIQTANSQIQKAKMEGPQQQAAMARMRTSIASEKAKIGGISRAPLMQDQLRDMERASRETRDSISTNERKVSNGSREAANLEREVAQIRIEIAKLKKDLAQKQQSAAPAPPP